MSVHWGVDSSGVPANGRVSVPPRYRREGETGPVREFLYDYVVRRAGGGVRNRPEFWGRYLNRSSARAHTRLRADEPGFLFQRRCKLLLVYNEMRTRPGPSGRNQRAGARAARDAVALADDFDVPDGVRIYCDLEFWTMTPGFLQGWCEVMYASRFAGAGGFYGRGADAERRPGSYLIDRRARIPTSGGWAGQLDEAEDLLHASRSDALFDELAGRARASKPFNIHVWSNTPRIVDSARDTPPNAQIRPPLFAAIGPQDTILSRTVIWQYRFSAFWPGGAQRGAVDLDLAKDVAFQDMWQGWG